MTDHAEDCEYQSASSENYEIDCTCGAQKLEDENAALRQEVERLTDTFLVCETIQPDGSLRATLKDVIRRAETAEAELESLRKERDALREKLKLV